MTANSTAINEEAIEYKEKGNSCVREEKYEEAILHYTHAIKLDPKNHSLYSNRSLAFLKISQYYHAHEDALEAIRLKPDWAKGYFRKGEVEAATFHFSDALLSYRCALELLPDDPTVTDAMKRTTALYNKDKKANEQVPWLGAGIGIIIGVIIVIADQIFTAKPSVTHPLLMAALTISVALLGFAFAKGFRYYLGCQRKGLLDAPMDLLKEMKKLDNDGYSDNKKIDSNHQRFTRAQGRLKLRKGKT
uniref:Putative molecular co-chaperone sti1 n=1 Tax=Triatoma infestans TaxID=30076 RepID=A0A023F8N7_TRIIF